MIDGIFGTGAPSGPTRLSARRGGSGFRIDDNPRADAPGAPEGAAEVAAASLGSILELQEQGAEPVQDKALHDRAARQRGRDLLAALAGLQRDLLGEGANAASLQALARLAADVPQAADPGLRDAVGAVAVRARIELARHTITVAGFASHP